MTICAGENDATEILPNLWLGNYKSANDIEFVTKVKIKHIINITKTIKNKWPDIKYMHIKMDDSDACDINLTEIFEKSTSYILRCLQNKEPILVHCKRGHHRSASIVAAFLIKYFNMELFNAVYYINNLRNCALVRKTCMAKGLIDFYLKNKSEKK